jgi:hypothetical protein
MLGGLLMRVLLVNTSSHATAHLNRRFKSDGY